MQSYFRLRDITCAVFVALAHIGCGDGDTQIVVKYASDYARPTANISVFGVFENGRLSPESWKEIGPLLSSSFGQGTCDNAWSDGFLNVNPALTSSIDDYTKDEGVTDELLDRLAPMAKGSSIVTFTVLGRRLTKGSDKGGKSPASVSAAPMRMGGAGRGMGGGGRGMRGGGGRRQSSATADGNAPGRSDYEITASLFSIRLHHSVALVSMSYSGPDVDAALAEFATKLRSAMPDVTCTGWNLDAHIDVNQVRKLTKPPPGTESSDEHP
jgi:hypothetical protein